jgi:hypothetical protein
MPLWCVFTSPAPDCDKANLIGKHHWREPSPHFLTLEWEVLHQLHLISPNLKNDENIHLVSPRG